MGLCSSSSRVSDASDPPDFVLTASKGGSLLVNRAEVASPRRRPNAASSAAHSGGWRPGDAIPPTGKIRASGRAIQLRDGGDHDHAPATVQLRYGYRTLQGRQPGPQKKPNQDSLVVEEDLRHLWPAAQGSAPEGDSAFFGVFDGHGPHGEHASTFCRFEVPKALVAETAYPDNVAAAFKGAFHGVHERFLQWGRATDVLSSVSGTTCITTLLLGRRLYIANLGDSRAVLGRYSARGEIEAVALSRDHCPSRGPERERIQRYGATIRSEAEIRPGGSNQKHYVVKEREDGMGLLYGVMFTRSIGDSDSHDVLGVIDEPEVDVRVLTPSDRFIILASDGIWDYVSNTEAVLVASQAKNPQRAAATLVKRARERWDAQDMDGRRDDITAIVIETTCKEEEGVAQAEDGHAVDGVGAAAGGSGEHK